MQFSRNVSFYRFLLARRLSLLSQVTPGSVYPNCIRVVFTVAVALGRFGEKANAEFDLVELGGLPVS